VSCDDFSQSSILIHDIISRALISINTSITAFQIAKMMEYCGIGTIIVKKNKHLIGIVTDRDFTTKITANSLSFDTPVKKIMSSLLITINHNKLITIAAKLMSNKKLENLQYLKILLI